MSPSLVLNRVYRLEVQSVVLVFLTQLCELLPLQPSLWFTSPTPPPTKVKVHIHIQYAGREWRGVELCFGDHILQEIDTLFLTRFRTYKIATPPQT